MKKFSFLFFLLVFVSGCGAPIPEETAVEEPAVDLSNVFAQVCETKEGPCSIMSCSLKGEQYDCAENVADIGKNCSSVKKLDDIVSAYTICGKENAEKLQIFSYAQSLEALQNGTPAEVEKKVAEEMATVENGGTSSFLSTMLATAGGMMLGGMISNALFNRPNALPPQMPPSAYEQPLNKDEMNKAKEGVAANESKLKDSAAKTKAKSKATASKKSSSATKKTTTSPKKTSSRKRR